MDENSNNNQNNNYNIYTSMNDDAFNVFNQSAQNNSAAVSPQQPVSNATPTTPAVPPTPAPVKPAPTKTTPDSLPPGMVTVNDYKEPKKPFHFKDLLKKKIEEEEKTFSIDDITNFKDTRVKVDVEELKEKKKKIKDIIVLILALIVLVIVGIVAYNVFSNYLLPNQNIIDSNTINRNINSSNVIDNSKDIVSYSCNYIADDTFYNFPAKDYIIWDNYKGTANYSFLNDKLDIITENIDINYNYMDDETNKIVIKYCNTYNKILDEYQFLCNYANYHLVITNTFYLNKIDKNINNFLGDYNLKYNKNNILGDIITNDNSCTLIK